MLVIEDLLRRVDADGDGELCGAAEVAFGAHQDLFPVGKAAVEHRAEIAGVFADAEDLFAREAELFGALAGQELQRKDAHADQVGPVDTLVTFGDGEADTEQARTFGGPVARRSRAVLLAGEDAERRPALGVGDRSVVNGHGNVVGQQTRDAALGAGREPVAQAYVGKGAAHHHLVVAAAGAVAVELDRLHAVLHQVFASGAIEFDGAGGRDVVGGDGVAQYGKDARAVDVLDRRRQGGHAVEVRRFADVGGIGLPAVRVA